MPIDVETQPGAATSSALPLLTLRGDPSETGFEYGQRSRARIHQCYELYARLIGGDDRWRRDQSNQYLDVIARQMPDLARELQGVADGSELPLWKVIFINARTELFLRNGTAAPVECTALCFPESALLGQNWDWLKDSEDMLDVLDIERSSGHRTVTVTESGMLAKIGMNNTGLGVCLNIMPGTPGTAGIPVHLLLRRLLDFTDLDSALQFLASAQFDTYSNILLADASGNHANVELDGTRLHRIDFRGSCPLHTNHYLTESSSAPLDPVLSRNSLVRLRRGRELLGELDGKDLRAMRRILADTDNLNEAICRSYSPSSIFDYRPDLLLGTVSSVIMDLRARVMWTTRGPPVANPYVRHEIGGS